jgi:hypothetical protein
MVCAAFVLCGDFASLWALGLLVMRTSSTSESVVEQTLQLQRQLSVRFDHVFCE